MNFIKSEAHDDPDESSISNDSVHPGAYFSEQESTLRWSPDFLNLQHNGICPNSISSDEGVYSSASDNSDTDPKTIQTESTAVLSEPINVPNNEKEDDFPSSELFSNPEDHSEKNRPDSSDSDCPESTSKHITRGEANGEKHGTHLSNTYNNPAYQPDEIRPGIPKLGSLDLSSIDITGGEAKCQENLCWRAKKPIFCLIVVIGFLAAIGVTIAVVIATSGAAEKPRVCTVTSEGKTKCQISEEYVEAVILNATKYVDEGNGEIIIPLSNTTDTTVYGIHLYVKDGYLFYSIPNARSCYEKGNYPVLLRNSSKTILQTLSPINIEKQGLDEPVNIAPVLYRNLTDGRDYVHLRCTVSHCDTVVTAAKLMIPNYSIIQKPMSCTYEETKDGLNTCTITMPRHRFENSQYIQCASVLSAAKPSVTIKATEDKYKEPVSSLAVLKHGQHSKIVRHVDISENENVVLEKDNKLLFTSGNPADSRISLSVSKTESEQIFEVTIGFSPATCIDVGVFAIRTGQGAFEIRSQVKDGPDLFPFPTTSTASIGARLVLKSVYCIGDGAQTVIVNTPGKTETGRLQAGNRAEFGYSDEYLIFDLKWNVLEMAYVKKVTMCQDHNKRVEIKVQDGNGGILLNISSEMQVKAHQYRISSTGGSFQETAVNKSITFTAYLGCRPVIRNVNLTINGKYDPSQDGDIFSSLQLTNDTGEMSIIKEYRLNEVTMQDNGTIINLTVSFLDDDGVSRLFNETVTVFVVPGGFCEGKQHGCNFKHPYRRDQYVACGQNVIAAIHACPEYGQVFKPSKCTGFCT